MRPTTWPEFLADYRARAAKGEAMLRAGIAHDGTPMTHRYIGPPMVPTPERYVRDAFESALAHGWAQRFDLWLRRVDAKKMTEQHGGAGYGGTFLRFDAVQKVEPLDAETIARLLGIKVTP